MPRIITIANQKGGVGKTTTAVNLAASLAAAERRTLLIDVDPQGNAGSALGIPRDDAEPSVYEVLLDGVPLAEVVKRTELKFLDLAPASRHLVGAELELAGEEDREQRLARAVAAVAAEYEYVLVDCPPSLGLLTLNGLVAAQGVIIPIQCEYFALEGLADVLRTIDLVKGAANPDLKVDGIVLTMHAANNLAQQVEDEIRKHFRKEVFKTVIPRNVRLSECPSHGKPILLYDVTSKGCQSYLELAREVVRRGDRAGRAALPSPTSGAPPSGVAWPPCSPTRLPLRRPRPARTQRPGAASSPCPSRRSSGTPASRASASTTRGWRSSPRPFASSGWSSPSSSAARDSATGSWPASGAGGRRSAPG
jgi:chromosome partitioning protein